VKTEAGFQPRIVRLGVTDFDYAEVLSGLREGDRVALLSVVEVQAQRNETMNRIRQRVGGGVPGVGGGSRTSGGGRRGGS
jgi:HlyD family secretion protein